MTKRRSRDYPEHVTGGGGLGRAGGRCGDYRYRQNNACAGATTTISTIIAVRSASRQHWQRGRGTAAGYSTPAAFAPCRHPFFFGSRCSAPSFSSHRSLSSWFLPPPAGAIVSVLSRPCTRDTSKAASRHPLALDSLFLLTPALTRPQSHSRRSSLPRPPPFCRYVSLPRLPPPHPRLSPYDAAPLATCCNHDG